MKRNNIFAVVSFSVIFVVVFAFIVPLIVYPSGYGDYEVFREIEQFRTWIDENTQDFKEGTDSYIGEIEPKSQLIGSFVYGDKEYSFAAYIFKEEKDRKNYYAARTGVSSDEKRLSFLQANYFGSTFVAYEENNLYFFSGGDYVKFEKMLDAFTAYLRENDENTVHKHGFDIIPFHDVAKV